MGTVEAGELTFDVDQLSKMAFDIDKATHRVVDVINGIWDRAQELDPEEPRVEVEVLKPWEAEYVRLAEGFNRLLEQAKVAVPESFILSLEAVPTDPALRTLPAHTAQLAERLATLSRFSHRDYTRWMEFIEAIKEEARAPAGSILERKAELLRKLADK